MLSLISGTRMLEYMGCSGYCATINDIFNRLCVDRIVEEFGFCRVNGSSIDGDRFIDCERHAYNCDALSTFP